jgi:hypothetical protein
MEDHDADDSPLLDAGPIVLDHATVQFTDGQRAEFTRVHILANGVLTAYLTRDALADVGTHVPAVVTDSVYYSPVAWHHVFTAPKGVLTAWMWRRDDSGAIREDRKTVATNLTSAECHEHAVAWLRRYQIAEQQLGEIAELAFTQRVTVSDPEALALKFFFHSPTITSEPAARRDRAS